MIDRNASPWSDADLRDYLAGSAPADVQAAIDAALETDRALENRLRQLDEVDPAIAGAFETLLGQAPAARLEADLAVAVARTDRDRAPRGVSRRFAMAGIAATVAGAFGLGVLGGRSSVPDGPVGEDPPRVGPAPVPPPKAPWFESVADYVSLFSTDTFTTAPLDVAGRRRGLRAAGDRTRLDLGRLDALGPLRLQRAEILQLDGKPLVQVAYLDASDQPVAVCILVRPKPAAPAPGGRTAFKTARVRDLQIVHWDHQPYGFLVIGKQPEPELQALAREVAAAITVA